MSAAGRHGFLVYLAPCASRGITSICDGRELGPDWTHDDPERPTGICLNLRCETQFVANFVLVFVVVLVVLRVAGWSVGRPGGGDALLINTSV